MAQDVSLVLQSSNRTTSSLSTLLAWMQPGPSLKVENAVSDQERPEILKTDCPIDLSVVKTEPGLIEYEPQIIYTMVSTGSGSDCNLHAGISTGERGEDNHNSESDALDTGNEDFHSVENEDSMWLAAKLEELSGEENEIVGISDEKHKWSRKRVRHKCERCCRNYFSKATLENHQQQCVAKLPHKCTNCGKGFALYKFLIVHQKRVHPPNHRNVCSGCGKRFVSEKLRDEHRKSHCCGLAKCGLCRQRGFSSKKRHSQHSLVGKGMSTDEQNVEVTTDDKKKTLSAQKVRKESGPSACVMCKAWFPARSTLRRHHRVCRPYQCQLCGKSYRKKDFLESHESIHRGEKTNACNVCGGKFFWKSTLGEHKRSHKRQSALKCKVCDKAFKVESSLRLHEERHDEEKRDCVICGKTCPLRLIKAHETRCRQNRCVKHVCDACGGAFATNSALKIHKRSCRPSDCKTCGQTFSTELKLREHRNRAHGEAYACQVCGNHYASYRQCKIHERSHRVGFSPCEICGKRVSASAYRKHVQNHDRKPETCDICGDTVSSLDNLRQHKRAKHTDEGLCPICGKRFSSVRKRKEHERRHLTVRPFLCQVCGLSYAMKSTLRHHHEVKHREVEFE